MEKIVMAVCENIKSLAVKYEVDRKTMANMLKPIKSYLLKLAVNKKSRKLTPKQIEFIYSKIGRPIKE